MKLIAFFICTVVICAAQPTQDNEKLSPSKKLMLSNKRNMLAELKKCNCREIYNPLCATNSKSYYNKCHFDCDPEIKDIRHEGYCVPYLDDQVA
ncbi:uncharacterized protein isoform X2 [Choristoneura fumiferana]|uniref:uncharacterized protein isoform X2 n=1 Tax=Choristoneura fumiferana TaxID=7141 RepID=UPI003D155775